MISKMELPDVETVADNIIQWKQYHDDLKIIISKADTFNENKLSVNRMKYMFDKYVVNKTFNPDQIKINGENRYSYSFDNVIMNYFGRMTFIVDDYDYFVDFKVTVDGNVIVDCICE